MRTLNRIWMISIAAIGLMVTSGLAQGPKPQSKPVQGDSDAVVSRAIRQKVRDGKLDGMELVVFDVKDGKHTPILDPGRNFTEGDEIKVQFWSSFDGYVYFVNVEPNGTKTIIYPVLGGKEENNMVRANQQYVLPRSTTFEFTGEKGIEIIQVIMSRKPIPFFDDAVRKSNGELGKTAANAVQELVSLASKKKSGIDSETIASVLPKDNQYIGTRKIRLAPPKDTTDQGTVIAIPDGLLNGGVAVFEIRLHHK